MSSTSKGRRAAPRRAAARPPSRLARLRARGADAPATPPRAPATVAEPPTVEQPAVAAAVATFPAEPITMEQPAVRPADRRGDRRGARREAPARSRGTLWSGSTLRAGGLRSGGLRSGTDGSASRWNEPLAPRARLVLWSLVVLAGLAGMIAPMVPVGPAWLGGVGTVALTAAYVWGLAVRTGGRAFVFTVLALVLGTGVLVADNDLLRSGAAVLVCVVAGVFAVMATVPAVTFGHAVREVLVALVVATGGGLAAVGYEPVVVLTRFEYVTLALALVASFATVYRLGAGLHGLGRRGFFAVLVGSVLLAVTLAYAEMLRRYGMPDVVESVMDATRWGREHLGAVPRPIMVLLGVPALVWGCHMRARRRQGWWFCAFGITATVPLIHMIVNPAASLAEAGISVLYSLLVGLAVGYVVIRLDLVLTGPRGARARRLEEAAAVRPEPARGQPLL